MCGDSHASRTARTLSSLSVSQARQDGCQQQQKRLDELCFVDQGTEVNA